jgi:hypothetical protein
LRATTETFWRSSPRESSLHMRSKGERPTQIDEQTKE